MRWQVIFLAVKQPVSWLIDKMEVILRTTNVRFIAILLRNTLKYINIIFQAI